MHPATVRYDVQRARVSGLSAAWVLTTYGVPARTQQRIIHESIRFGMTDPELRAQQGVGRPTALTDEHRRLITGWLAQEPEIAGVQLLRRLTSEHGYRGGKTAFYDYLRQRPRPQAAPLPVVRFEGVAGEFAQHDFGTLTVRYQDGKEEKLTFYAGRLKYSRALHVCLVEGETAEAFIRGMEGFAAAVGGLPLLNVVDNTKAAVIKRTKDPETGKVRIQLQRDLGSFLAEVGVFAEPTAPYSGNQKGSVENLVRFVKENFLRARQFRNREDLETQLGEWRHWVNQERKCEATGEIPFTRLEEERSYLKAVPVREEGYGLVRSAVGGRDGWVRFAGYRFSVPHPWIGQVVEVRLHRHTVVLRYQGERVQHPRTPENGKYSLLPEHQQAFFVKPRGAVMLQRQLLMDLAPVVERFFTELVHRRPDTWREKDLPSLWEQYERVGTAAFLRAVSGCVAAATYGREYVTERLAREPAVREGRAA